MNVEITLQNYEEQVERFCSPLPLPLHNSHMTLGIVEEITTELVKAFSPEKGMDLKNAVEELGDIAWFASQYCRKNGIIFADLLKKSYDMFVANEIIFDELEGTNELLLVSVTKKEIAYGKIPTKEQREEAILNICHQIVLYSFHIMRSQIIKTKQEACFATLTEEMKQEDAMTALQAASQLSEDETSNTISTLLSWIVSTVLATNWHKLSARYGDKFSEDRANNRDLAAEDAVLAESIETAK
jgi:hypothetical protein